MILYLRICEVESLLGVGLHDLLFASICFGCNSIRCSFFFFFIVEELLLIGVNILHVSHVSEPEKHKGCELTKSQIQWSPIPKSRKVSFYPLWRQQLNKTKIRCEDALPNKEQMIQEDRRRPFFLKLWFLQELKNNNKSNASVQTKKQLLLLWARNNT